MASLSSTSKAFLLAICASLQVLPASAGLSEFFQSIGKHVDPFFCYTLGKCRRRLGGVEIQLTGKNVVDHEGWKSFKESCQEHEFELKLYVDTHLALIATPVKENTGCDSMVFHAIEEPETGNMQKQILRFDNNPKILDFVNKEAIELETHSMEKLAQAFDSAPTAQAADIVKNNCGDFIKHFASALEIKVTPQLTMQIASRLANSSVGKFTEKLRASEHVDMIGGASVDDEELIKQLVELRTRDLYN